MIAGVWGKKIGMTQVFDGDKVVPVTAIDINHWVITGLKTSVKDGYDAIQVGCIKPRYLDQKFSDMWLKKLKKYFSFVREIKLKELKNNFVIGNKIDFQTMLAVGDVVDVFGITKGAGFAGVVKRHNYTGGRASHGCMMGNRPGSISGACAEGKVYKGKALPGHMGVVQRAAAGLKVIKMVDAPHAVVLVKGSVPGKSGSLVFLRKAITK